MSNEDKFKGLLNEKLGSNEFPFNVGNWEKARKMIDTSHAKRRRFTIFIFSSILLIITGILCTLLFTGESKNSSKSPTSATNSSRVVISKLDPRNSSDHMPTLAIPVRESPVEINKNEPQSPENGTDHSGTRAIKNRKTTAEQIGRKGTISKANEKMKKTSKIASLPAEIFAAADRNSSLLKRKQKTAETSFDNKVGSIIASTGKKKNNSALVNSSATKIDESRGAVINMSRKNNRSDKNGESAPVTNKKEEQAAQPIETNSILNEMQLPASNALSLETVGTFSTSAVNTVTAASITNNLEITKNEMFKNIFSVEAGAYYHVGWKNTKGVDANGLNPVLGIHYTRLFGSKIGISLGAVYATIGSLSDYSSESSNTKYGFGLEKNVTVITPVKIHYLLAPLRIVYAIDYKNSVGLGYSFGYLLAVNNKVENYTQRLNTGSNELAKKVSKTKLYEEGFSTFDSQLAVFYRRKFYQDLSVNAEFFFGLTDIKGNSFFGTRGFERNSGAKITLIYNLFKK